MADTPAALDEDRFRIDSRVEIAFILRALMKSGALVTAYFNHGREFIVTAVLEVDTDSGHVILDSGTNRELNERVLKRSEINVVSSQDGIRVQFGASQVEACSFEGRLAFRVPLPDSLIKLQRREYYRLTTPVLRPLKCEIPSPDGKRIDLVVADISLGGICLVGQAAGISLEPDTIFEGCRIVLPDVGPITFGLSVRNAYTVTLKNGVLSRRTGCELLNLGAQQEAMIQRYIIKLERERRAKQLDGGS
jgi:c-di-GMP-binding flagellar brake protein YcgR